MAFLFLQSEPTVLLKQYIYYLNSIDNFVLCLPTGYNNDNNVMRDCVLYIL